MVAKVKKEFRELKLTALVGGLETRVDSTIEAMKPEDGLCKSMAESGLQVPILVRPKGRGKYQIVAGYRRVRAATLIEWDTIPAIIVPLDDNQLDTARMLENFHRKNNTPPELCKIAWEHHKRTGEPSKVLAKAIGVSDNYPANLIRAWSILSTDERDAWLAEPGSRSVKKVIAAAAAAKKGESVADVIAAPKLRKRKDLTDARDKLLAMGKRDATETGFLLGLEFALNASDWTPLLFEGDGEPAPIPDTYTGKGKAKAK